MIGLALLSLVFAALLPTYRARRFDRMAEDAIQDVATLRDATERARELNGAWPPAAPAGEVPEGAAGAFPDSVLGGQGYTLEWRLLDRVEYVLTPVVVPPIPILDPDEEPDPGALEPDDPPADSAAFRRVATVHDMGVIVVHASDERLLAALLAHHGADDSFVRDTTWTLVIPPAS